MFSENTAPAIAAVRAKPTLYFIAQNWTEKALPYFKTVLPETKAVVLGGMMMFWEQPEAFNRAIDEFISNNVPAPAQQNA